MTREEIEGVWARVAHRSDLSGDFAWLWALTRQRIRDRMMVWGPVLEDEEAEVASMAAAPQLWVSGGLIEIFRLADDAEAQAREATMFEGAASDFIMRASQAGGPAIMGKRVYGNGN